LEDGKYEFNGKQLQVDVNEKDRSTALHGLLFERVMTIKSHSVDAEHAEVSLVYEFDGSDTGYPFRLGVEIIHRLVARNDRLEFEIETVAYNNGTEPLPFATGWHPYFRLFPSLDLDTEGNVDELLLTIPGGDGVATDSRLLPTGQVEEAKPMNATPLKGFEFDGCVRAEASKAADAPAKQLIYEAKLTNKPAGVELVLWQDHNFPYLQKYIPPSRNSIALEPMTHLPNAFRTGTLVLGPKAQSASDEFRGKYGVYLQRA